MSEDANLYHRPQIVVNRKILFVYTPLFEAVSDRERPAGYMAAVRKRRRVGKIHSEAAAAWANRAFTPVFDGLWRARFCPRGRAEQRAFAHPTRSQVLFSPACRRPPVGRSEERRGGEECRS